MSTMRESIETTAFLVLCLLLCAAAMADSEASQA